MLHSVNNQILCRSFSDLEVFIYDTAYLKNSLYEFCSALFIQRLHYFSFTIQLVMLCVLNVKVKNLAFGTSKTITNVWFSLKN